MPDIPDIAMIFMKSATVAADDILAEIKKAGRGWQFQTNAQLDQRRKQFANIIVDEFVKQLKAAEGGCDDDSQN